MKTKPWNKIKAEYLAGCTVSDLAKKYKIKPREISDKAYREDWLREKTRISESIKDEVAEKVKSITDKALQRLTELLERENDDIKDSDLISAIKSALDVSGLKSEKRELLGDLPMNIEFNFNKKR